MNTIKLDITEGQINNAIAVAIAEAFTPEKKDALIRDIIRSHITTRVNSYDKDTLFSKAVNSQLQEMVRVKLAEMVATMQPQVDALVAERFPGLQVQVLDQLKEALQRAALGEMQIKVKFVEPAQPIYET